MDISFIIPSYNSGKTIKKAINSILKQDNNSLEYEIIVVDDGSTDNTEEIIENLNENIKFIKKENGGVSSARNRGIKEATGEYIVFVDSDDYISKTLLKDIEKYVEKDIDLIKWSPTLVDKKGNNIKQPNINGFVETSGEDGFNRLFGTDPLLDCLWNYAIKKDIVLEFPDGREHEDFAIMPLIILSAEKMVIIDELEYFYVQTDKSIMRGNSLEKQRKKLEDILINFDNLIETSSKMNISDYTKENVGIFAANSLLVIVPELSGDNKEYFIEELRKRSISKYIKARNLKQCIKKVWLSIKY